VLILFPKPGGNMSRNGKRLKALRGAKRALQRDNDKEGDLKNNISDETRKARAKPAAIGSKIILREDESNMSPTPGLSDLIRKKHGEKTLSQEEVRSWIHNGHRATPHPEFAYPGIVET